MLRQLREQGLITVKEGRVEINDVKGLMKLAGYDSGYLDQPLPLIDLDD